MLGGALALRGRHLCFSLFHAEARETAEPWLILNLYPMSNRDTLPPTEQIIHDVPAIEVNWDACNFHY